jgi:hypothetical protein
VGSGRLILLLGAVQNWVDLQKKPEQCIYSIVDLHALSTTKSDATDLRAQIRETAALLLACGINPKKSILYQQSKVQFSRFMFDLMRLFSSGVVLSLGCGSCRAVVDLDLSGACGVAISHDTVQDESPVGPGCGSSWTFVVSGADGSRHSVVPVYTRFPILMFFAYSFWIVPLLCLAARISCSI